MVKARIILFLVLMLFVLGFSLYYLKLRIPSESSYKYYVELPEVLTEQNCMEVLKVYQPDITNLTFEKKSSENFTYKQVSFAIKGLFPNGRRTITFTYPNQQFEGCNILDTYTLKRLMVWDRLTEEQKFGQYFDCEELDCKDIECKGRDARLFYTYRKVNDYYELKYYMRQPTEISVEEPSPEEIPTKPAVSITVQFLYFNRPLDEFIEYRENSICKEEE